MKRLLNIFAIGFITPIVTSTVACDVSTVDIFFRDPAVNASAIASIKAIDFKSVTTLKEIDYQIVDILEQAVEDNNINHIIPGTISINDYFYFYSDDRSNREVITDIDADKNGIIDFEYINYVIKVNYEERDGFETDFEDDLLYIYNTPIDSTTNNFNVGMQNTTRRTINVEYERRDSTAQVYNRVVEEFSELLAQYVTKNENMIGFVGGFYNDIDLKLTIPNVSDGASIKTSEKYVASIESGGGISLPEPILFDLKFYRD